MPWFAKITINGTTEDEMFMMYVETTAHAEKNVDHARAELCSPGDGMLKSFCSWWCVFSLKFKRAYLLNSSVESGMGLRLTIEARTIGRPLHKPLN